MNRMTDQRGLFDVDGRLRELSAKGDDLERLKLLVSFENFRGDLERAVPRSDRAKGGRPAYDHVLMFKILVLQSAHTLSDERTEYLDTRINWLSNVAFRGVKAVSASSSA